MARSDQGAALGVNLLQPGWSIQSDGFGLNTASATFKVNAADAPAINVRGQSFPKTGYEYLKAHKSSISYDALGLATMRVDYVGIDPTVNDGSRTNPNTSVANGLTSENITAHPNFFVKAEGSGFLGPIAGAAPYSQDAPDNFAPNVNGAPAYLGLNGACFEKKNGGRFIGFVNPTYPQYFGKTQYLAATTTYSGTVYYSNAAFVQALYLLLNTATSSNGWGSSYPLIPSWGPTGTGLFGNNQNLLSQVNVEEFGSLYKVNYEIRYSKVGWERDVYVNIES
jgi:hypothetical protein